MPRSPCRKVLDIAVPSLPLFEEAGFPLFAFPLPYSLPNVFGPAIPSGTRLFAFESQSLLSGNRSKIPSARSERKPKLINACCKVATSDPLLPILKVCYLHMRYRGKQKKHCEDIERVYTQSASSYSSQLHPCPCLFHYNF